jgi:Nucleotidyl transferase AbiEii toxin, Type IV TA system
MPGFVPSMAMLPAAQQAIWPTLASLSSLDYVPYGGTAIALRLGHRVSVDFDFFSSAPMNRAALHAAMPSLAQARTLQDQPDAWTLLLEDPKHVGQSVKLSFFAGIGFGRVGTPDSTQDAVLHVASLIDLLATELKVILQRAEAKDYIDIAALLNAGLNLAEGLAAARLLFGLNFQPSESLKALTFYGDGDLHTVSAAERAYLIAAVQAVRDLPAVSLLSHKLHAR